MILFFSLVHLCSYIRFSNQESLQKQTKVILVEYSARAFHVSENLLPLLNMDSKQSGCLKEGSQLSNNIYGHSVCY